MLGPWVQMMSWSAIHGKFGDEGQIGPSWASYGDNRRSLWGPIDHLGANLWRKDCLHALSLPSSKYFNFLTTFLARVWSLFWLRSWPWPWRCLLLLNGWICHWVWPSAVPLTTSVSHSLAYRILTAFPEITPGYVPDYLSVASLRLPPIPNYSGDCDLENPPGTSIPACELKGQERENLSLKWIWFVGFHLWLNSVTWPLPLENFRPATGDSSDY